jgi:hypothetical protein
MKVKDLKQIIEKLDDNVELYYPHYYKGYGLVPVNKLEIGDVCGERVGVFDWDTMLLDNSNFALKKGELITEIAKRLEHDHKEVLKDHDHAC